MTQEAQELVKKALALIDNERDAEWRAEIARRLDEVASGKVETIPWSEVSKKGRSLIHER